MHFEPFKCCLQRILCSDFRSQLLFLFYENRPAKTQFQIGPFSTNTRPEKIQTPPDRSATPYYVESFRFSAWVHGMNIQNIESIVLNLDLKPIFWIDCRQHEQCSSHFIKPNNCETCKNQKDAQPNFLQESVLSNSPSFF